MNQFLPTMSEMAETLARFAFKHGIPLTRFLRPFPLAHRPTLRLYRWR
jgi:hypothetical protein